MAAGVFKFNFGLAGPSHEADTAEEEEHVTVTAAAEEFDFRDRALFVAFTTVDIVDSSGGRVALKKAVVDSAAVARIVSAEGAAAASDLIPGKYEGGFKLWEGALDLATVLLNRAGGCGAAMESPLAGQRVLELGCGHGLPGVLAALLGAQVVFQDFNREVLERVTCPNVCANLPALAADPAAAGRHRFLSGDFESVGRLLGAEAAKFDVVLASEAIYNSTSAAQLLDACKACMRRGGVFLVAAKTHYFGVGGGLAAFKRMVGDACVFDLEVVWRSDDGVSNMREVLALTFSSSAEH